MNKTYYQLLEISPRATQHQIKKAYRKQCFKYHPDKNTTLPVEQCHAMMRLVTEAYNVLSDPALKAQYDEQYSTDTMKPDWSNKETSPSTPHQSARYKRNKRIAIGVVIGLVISLVGGMLMREIKIVPHENSEQKVKIILNDLDKEFKQYIDEKR